MHESPRIRRLRSDLSALEKLRSESTLFDFQATGKPPHLYLVTFKGSGLCRDRGKVRIAHYHRVEIKLGASYPRTIPELRWITPVYHPNISEIGMVCLGGYGTHWVPSVQLDELCTMLWDMARFFNYDIRSPYNRDAALWVANQTSILFPTDSRALRDVRVAQGRVETKKEPSQVPSDGAMSGRTSRSEPGKMWDSLSTVGRVFQFMERRRRPGDNNTAPRLPDPGGFAAGSPRLGPVDLELHGEPVAALTGSANGDQAAAVVLDAPADPTNGQRGDPEPDTVVIVETVENVPDDGLAPEARTSDEILYIT